MNKNTKRKAALVRRNIRASGGGANINSSVERAKGVTRTGAPRKAWRGAGDPLKRGKVDYNFTTPSPYQRAKGGFLKVVARVIAAGTTLPPLRNREVVDLISPRVKREV